MEPLRFLTGRCTDGSLLWASIDATAHHCHGRTADRRFSAYVAPFPSEEAARAALTAAGAQRIEAEARPGRRKLSIRA